MSFEGFPGCEVRAKLDHPVVDADAHVVECDFAHLDFVRQIGGEDVARQVLASLSFTSREACHLILSRAC